MFSKCFLFESTGPLATGKYSYLKEPGNRGSYSYLNKATAIFFLFSRQICQKSIVGGRNKN
jgi:hypothetical protein